MHHPRRLLLRALPNDVCPLAGEYIRLVGFGNAIGLLAEMQLPGFEVPMQSI